MNTILEIIAGAYIAIAWIFAVLIYAVVGLPFMIIEGIRKLIRNVLQKE